MASVVRNVSESAHSVCDLGGTPGQERCDHRDLGGAKGHRTGALLLGDRSSAANTDAYSAHHQFGTLVMHSVLPQAPCDIPTRCSVPAFGGAHSATDWKDALWDKFFTAAPQRGREAIRRAIQNSQESLRTLAERYGINQKTVAKWKKRRAVFDLPTGPKEPESTVLSTEEEAIVVAFRRHTLLPLDDCLYALQATIPHLSRSSLHRCLQRHDMSRLPELADTKLDRKKFKTYPIGYFHIDIAEVRTQKEELSIC